MIGGEWRDSASGRTFAVIDPSTGDRLVEVAEGDAADVDAAVRSARRAFTEGPWRRLKPAERQRTIWRIADLIEAHAEEFALLETLDVGKPITNSRRDDVPLSVAYFRYMAGWATRLDGRSIDVSLPGEWHVYTVREPVGVVGAIIPWNSPLLMAAWKLAPALVCGNAVVIKPAEETPLSVLRLAALMQEADVPDGVVNVVTGFGHTAGAALAAHGDVDKVAFTGSTEVGKSIISAAAGNMKRVSLELGGKSPNIIMPDADLSQAVPGSGAAIFYNSGESCTAGSRIYAHKQVFDEVVDGIAEYARNIRIGPPLELDTEMGPVVSERHMERIQSFFESGRLEGAETVTGGRRRGDVGYFVEPTVLVNAKPQMRVVREEIFGPVVVAQAFETLDEVAAAANDTPYGLGAGVWTSDLTAAHRLARRLQAGSVYVNNFQPTDPAVPFGGVKQSGWGREHADKALDLYTEQKGVYVKLGDES